MKPEMADDPGQCQYMFARKGPGSPVHQCTAKAKYGERFCWRHLKYRNMPVTDDGCKQSRRLMGKK